MFRKILICAVTIAALLSFGCGGEEKIIGTPDKAILAYVETVMTGESANLQAAGFSEDEKNALRQSMANRFIESMATVAPLGAAAAQELAQIYFDNLKNKMTFKATLKSEGEQPVVELTTTPIDYETTAKAGAVGNDEFIALMGMVGKLKADGATDEQLKDNPELQKLAVTAIGKYIAGISFQPEKTFEIPCQKVTGAGGNTHWAPADGKVLIDLLTGQK